MIKSVEILEMDDLMSDLFDHEIEAYEKMSDALSISTDKLNFPCDDN